MILFYSNQESGSSRIIFMLPLPAPYKVCPLLASFFKVFTLPQKFNRFQLPLPHPCPMFYEKCFRFWLLKKLHASEFASSFFKVLPFSIPQKFNRFHFPGSN